MKHTGTRTGKLIRAARIAAGLSQLDLADALDVHVSTVRRLEHSWRAPTAIEVAAIAAVTGTPRRRPTLPLVDEQLRDIEERVAEQEVATGQMLEILTRPSSNGAADEEVLA